MKILGITGGSGSGKTTLLRQVEAMGGCVIDCDVVYHHLLDTDREMIDAIDARFPGVVVEGVLDRKKLGKVVFEDENALADLNRLVHPFVDREVRRLLEEARQRGCTLAAVDAIALVESGLGGLCDLTVAVIAPAEDRIRRLMDREGISEDYARLRLSAQKTDDDFRAQCGAVLVNDYPTAAEFAAACDTFLHHWIGGTNHE